MACGIGVARAADNTECRKALADGLLGPLSRGATDSGLHITSDDFVEIFSKNFNVCRDYLLARTSPMEDIHIDDPLLKMNVNWDSVKIDVATQLTRNSKYRTMYVGRTEWAIDNWTYDLFTDAPDLKTPLDTVMAMLTGDKVYHWATSLFQITTGGCFTKCDSDSTTAPTDDLNVKVFRSTFGYNLCVDPDTFILRKMSGPTFRPEEPFVTTDDVWAIADKKIRTLVAEQGHCDGNLANIVMRTAIPLYDPSTLNLTTDMEHYSWIVDEFYIDD